MIHSQPSVDPRAYREDITNIKIHEANEVFTDVRDLRWITVGFWNDKFVAGHSALQGTLPDQVSFSIFKPGWGLSDNIFNRGHG